MHLLKFLLAAAGLVAACGRPAAARAQGGEQLLFVGTKVGPGVGAYNSTTLITGADVRAQFPLSPQAAIIARTGLEPFFYKRYYYGGYYYYYSYTERVMALQIPVTVGPRFYVHKGLHAGLNLGVDIGVKDALTAFHFEPAVGYALRLSNGRYLDLGTSFTTSFGRGSGEFAFSFAYGLKLGR